MSELARAFGTIVRSARDRRGWSRAQLAEIAGIDAQLLESIEDGRQEPNLSTEERIAVALSVSLGQLLTAVDEERAR